MELTRTRHDDTLAHNIVNLNILVTGHMHLMF